MPQSKLTPEDLYQIYLEAGPKIDTFAENLWNDHFNNSQSDLYLGQSYQEGLKRAALDVAKLGFYFDPNHNPEPLIQQYLEERGGKFITWLSNTGKKEFADLLVEAYTNTGSYDEFRKLFKEKYPYWKDWKNAQLWTTENNLAVADASYNVREAYRIPYFSIINGPVPCVLCQTEAMYIHRLGENEPIYHVYCMCTVKPELSDEGWNRKPDYSLFKNEKEKDRFYKNYNNFNKEDKRTIQKYTEKDMRKAIDDAVAKLDQSKK